MKARLGTVLLAFVLLAGLTPAFANVLAPDAPIKADCKGVTMTFTGSDFAPGEVINVTYTLRWTKNGITQTPIIGTTQITQNGTTVVFLTWADLGQTNTCGNDVWLTVVPNPPGDSSVYSLYSWTGTSGGSASTFHPDPTGKLGFTAAECPCVKPETCRTPGYWGTHTNIVQTLIPSKGTPLVCGVTINTWLTDYRSSTEEAVCVEPRGDQRLQLARQLVSTALNCLVTGSPATCDGMSIGSVFTQCNTVCTGGPGSLTTQQCIDQLDCWNNGGQWTGTMCQMGTCSNDQTPCDTDDACGTGNTCVALANNCHDRALPGGDMPANSSADCTTAKKNACNIFGGCTH